jgi:hypothetical protein
MEEWRTRRPRRVTRESITPGSSVHTARERARLLERQQLKGERRFRAHEARRAERHYRANLSVPLHTLDVRQVLGIAGGLALVVAAFAPMLEIPLAGTLTYIGSGSSDGGLVLIWGVAALVFTMVKRWMWLLVPAVMTVLVAGFTFVRFFRLWNGSESEGALSDAMTRGQLQWGWAALLIGVFLLVTSALMKPYEPRESSL